MRPPTYIELAGASSSYGKSSEIDVMSSTHELPVPEQVHYKLMEKPKFVLLSVVATTFVLFQEYKFHSRIIKLSLDLRRAAAIL